MSLAVLLVALAGLGAGVAAIILDARKRFVVAFGGDGVRVERGSPPRDFIRGCRDVARMYGVNRGKVYALRTRSGVQLRFSRGIPERARQPLRNVWTPSPPPRGGGGARKRA